MTVTTTIRKPAMQYHFRGPVLRGGETVASYSRTVDGRAIYPALTRAEVLAEAKQAGARAIFPHGHEKSER